MRGPELARLIRARQPKLPVLFISGYDDSEVAAAGTAEPGTAFLAKPFASRGLEEAVGRLLAAPPPQP